MLLYPGHKCLGGVIVGSALLVFLAVLAAAAFIKEPGCEDDNDNTCEFNHDASAMLQLRSMRSQWVKTDLSKELAREAEWQEDAKHRARKVKAFFEMCPARGSSRRASSSSSSSSSSFSASSSSSELRADSERMMLEARYGKSTTANCNLSSQMVLEEDTPTGVKYSCCDLSRTDCGGCAKMVDKVVYKTCVKCRGGYTKIPAQTGQCTACLDIVGWKDIDGDNCFNTTCSDLKVQGISSNDACCKCGRGQQAATAFAYRTDHVLLGSNSVQGGPVPRTATRYSLNVGCNLGARGLTINGSTGELLRLPNSSTSDGFADLGSSPFSESCTITAHQTPSLNYSTTISVQATWFAYQTFSNEAIVIEPASLSGQAKAEAKKSTSKKHVSLLGEVQQHHDNAREQDHFQAPQAVVLPLMNNHYMCYNTGRWWCTYQLQCATIQSEDWLQIDSKGDFMVEGYPPEDAPGLTGIAAWDGQVGVAGSNCELTVTNRIGFPGMPQTAKTIEALKYDVAAVRPEVWPSFEYQTDVLRSTAGQPNPPLYVIPPKISDSASASKPQGFSNGPQAYAKPTRYSIACSESPKQLSGRTSFAFDQTTGAGTLNGMPFLTLDVAAGTLRVSPGIELISVLDTLDSTDVHRQLVLTCSIFAHFDFFIAAANPATSTAMTIYLEDDTCWKTVTADFLKPTARYPAIYVNASSEASCRNQCRADARCSHYAWSPSAAVANDTISTTGTVTECEFLHYRCSTLTTDCRVVTSQEKIKNCGEQNSCLRLTFEHHWDYSGWYCPKAQAGFLGWTYERQSITLEDTLWFAPFNPNRHTACSKGQWLIQRPGKTDYLDEEHFIAELDGVVRLCLDAGGDVTELALRDGIVNLTVVSSPYDPSIAANLKSGTASIENPTCAAPNITELLDQANEEAPSSDAEGSYSVVPVVLDDPTTQTPDDHWLHPCSCFSEDLWGQASPVDQSSFQDIPAGSNNQYVPQPFEIVDGEYVCEPRSLINITILLDKAESDFDELCEDNCKQLENCTHYWLGSASSTKQCRLYQACGVLVREVGLAGKLMGMVSRLGTVCRIANPNLCREVSYRRQYLGAPVSKQSLVPAPFSDCVFGKLVEQCDFKVLLQQLGINTCGVCSYSTQASANWAGKQPPPTGRPSGYQLEGTCWDERYTPVPVSGTGPSTLPATNWEGHQVLTCLSGTWIGPDGQEGFGNFACATCVTVAASPYRSFMNQGKQELYFTSHQELSFYVLTSPEKKLSSDGTLILSPLDPQQANVPVRQPPDTIYGNLTSTYAESNIKQGLCLGVEADQPVDIDPATSTLTIDVTVEILNGSDWEPDDNVAITTNVGANGAWRAVTAGRVFDSVPSLRASQRSNPSAVGSQTATCSDTTSSLTFDDQNCQDCSRDLHQGRPQRCRGRCRRQWPGRIDDDGSLCLEVTSDEPYKGNMTEDTNKATGSKGPYQWLVLLKCDPEQQNQRFHWSGNNLVNSKTGLCISIYPYAHSSTTQGYATAETCSNLTALTIDSSSPNRVKMAYNPTLSYSSTDDEGNPTTVIQTVSALCLGWMKVKKNSDEDAVRVATYADCIASNADDLSIRSGSMNPDQLRWHLGTGIISLNDWGISCDDGYALNRFQFEAGKVSYTCMSMGAVGSCSSILSKEVDTMKQDLTQLPKLDLDCGHGALTEIHAELASGAATIKYSYTCCQLTEPATILLTGSEVTEKIPVFSGVYCSEESRDISGRLAYKQRSWFHTETSTTTTPVTFELYFDHLNGTWCLSAADCMENDVPYPTDDPLMGTQVWQALEVTDFNYNPTPRGLGKKKRTFPTLLQFKAIQPQYARECQDDVTPGQSGFDRDQMNKVMADLPQQNPCSLVGGNSKGGMPSYKPAKSAYGDPGDPVYGVTYKDVWDCRMRQKSRNRDQLNYNQANGAANLVRTSLKGYKGLLCAAFPTVGAWAGFGGGMDAEKDIGKICAQGVDNILTTMETIQGIVALVKAKEMFNNNGGDCEPSRHGLARVFCDLHCIRDAVRAGDAAILKSMEQASQIQTENNKLLIEYYTGLILDRLDAESGSSGSFFLQEEIKADIVAAQQYTDRLFQEMHDVVASSRLDEAGSASLSRELNTFLAEEQEHFKFRSSKGQHEEVGKNSSLADFRLQFQEDVAQLAQRAERLHIVAHGAASQGLSQKADVERRVHDFVIMHEELLASYNHQLGRFKERSHFSQQLQQSLMRTIEPSLTDLAQQTEALGLEELMLSLDSTWWELRSAFDEGLEAVSDHMSAMEETTALLKDYTSICALEYPDLLSSFHSTMRVVDESTSKLFNVWETAVSLTGLLTSKLVDGGAFDHFARADLLSVDVHQVLTGLAPNRTRNLSPEQVSLLDRNSLCMEEMSEEASEAAAWRWRTLHLVRLERGSGSNTCIRLESSLLSWRAWSISMVLLALERFVESTIWKILPTVCTRASLRASREGQSWSRMRSVVSDENLA